MKFRGFRPDPYEEDIQFSELRYCFGGGGGGGGGGGDGDSSSGSGMSPAAAGEAGASDNAGEGSGDYGGGDSGSSGSGMSPAAAGETGATDTTSTSTSSGSGMSPDAAGETSMESNMDYTPSDSFTDSTDYNPADWADDNEAMSWAENAAAPAEDIDSISYQFDLLNLEDPTEVDAQTAYDYAKVMGQQFNAPEGFANDVYGVAAQPGFFESAATNIGQAIGLVAPDTFVVDPSRDPGDKVGAVTSEYGIMDAVATAMIPFTTIDTKTATFPSGQTQGYGEANFGLGFGVSVGTGLTPTSSTDVGVTSGGTGIGGSEDSGTEGEEYTQAGSGYTTDYEKSVASAGGSPRSKLLPYFMQQQTPNYVYYNQSSNPYAYYREGGEVQQMDELLANPLPVVDIAEVQKDPDSYLKNPQNANSAEELDEIYRHNNYILEISRQPIQAQEGMQVGQPAPEGGDGPMGFVGQQPENVSEGQTVADDVPLEVEEGTFVINAAAVEFAGSEDIKTMIMDALTEAEKQGLDISGDGNKINKERQVSLLVSRGEVLIPPALAKIIGYDKLNKINNRGKEETEQRIAENGQAPEQPANPAEGMAMAAMGGEQGQNNVADTEVIDVYRSIITQGGDPGKFQVFEEAFQAYQKGKAYRPMQSEVGTPEFDEEVRSKYGYAFPKTEGGIFETEHRDSPRTKMSGGGFAESLARATEKYAEREPQAILHNLQMSDDRQEIAGEVIGDGFAVRGRANRAEDARTTEYPDGVVVDEENKNLGFAIDGELYLFDDTWLNAGIEKQKGSVKGTANIPTGDKVMFGDAFEMTRYNMGATFGDLNVDVSGMPGEGVDRGRIKYKLNKNGDELSIEGDKSGNISAGLRLSF